jgi:hypothetical protein
MRAVPSSKSPSFLRKNKNCRVPGSFYVGKNSLFINELRFLQKIRQKFCSLPPRLEKFFEYRAALFL